MSTQGEWMPTNYHRYMEGLHQQKWQYLTRNHWGDVVRIDEEWREVPHLFKGDEHGTQ